MATLKHKRVTHHSYRIWCVALRDNTTPVALCRETRQQRWLPYVFFKYDSYIMRKAQAAASLQQIWDRTNIPITSIDTVTCCGNLNSGSLLILSAVIAYQLCLGDNMAFHCYFYYISWTKNTHNQDDEY